MAHNKYFSRAAFPLLAVMVMLFCGCKQLAHTEKDKHEIKPTEIDSTALIQERIVDTITLVSDSIQPDSIAPSFADSLAYPFDSIAFDDSLKFHLDSLQIDSLRQDTIIQTKPRLR